MSAMQFYTDESKQDGPFEHEMLFWIVHKKEIYNIPFYVKST
jgi:hypothetical protein